MPTHTVSDPPVENDFDRAGLNIQFHENWLDSDNETETTPGGKVLKTIAGLVAAAESLREHEIYANETARNAGEAAASNGQYALQTDTGQEYVKADGSYRVTNRVFNIGAIVAALALKSSLSDADLMPISDSDDSDASKAVSWANFKSQLKTYLDSFYATQAALDALTSTVGEKVAQSVYDAFVSDTTDAFNALGAISLNDEIAEGDLATALADLINGKADTSAMTTALAAKATQAALDALTDVVNGLGDLAEIDEVEEIDLADALANKINGKVEQSDIDTSLAPATTRINKNEVPDSVVRFADRDKLSVEKTGAPSGRTAFTAGEIRVHARFGEVLVIRSEDIPADPGYLDIPLRMADLVTETDTYALEMQAFRWTDPADPEGNAVEFMVQTLNGNLNTVSTKSLAVTNPMVADADPVSVKQMISRDATKNPDYTIPATARAVDLFVRVHGVGHEVGLCFARFGLSTDAQADRSALTALSESFDTAESANTAFKTGAAGQLKIRQGHVDTAAFLAASAEGERGRVGAQTYRHDVVDAVPVATPVSDDEQDRLNAALIAAVETLDGLNASTLPGIGEVAALLTSAAVQAYLNAEAVGSGRNERYLSDHLELFRGPEGHLLEPVIVGGSDRRPALAWDPVRARFDWPHTVSGLTLALHGTGMDGGFDEAEIPGLVGYIPDENGNPVYTISRYGPYAHQIYLGPTGQDESGIDYRSGVELPVLTFRDVNAISADPDGSLNLSLSQRTRKGDLRTASPALNSVSVNGLAYGQIVTDHGLLPVRAPIEGKGEPIADFGHPLEIYFQFHQSQGGDSGGVAPEIPAMARYESLGLGGKAVPGYDPGYISSDEPITLAEIEDGFYSLTDGQNSTQRTHVTEGFSAAGLGRQLSDRRASVTISCPRGGSALENLRKVPPSGAGYHSYENILAWLAKLPNVAAAYGMDYRIRWVQLQQGENGALQDNAGKTFEERRDDWISQFAGWRGELITDFVAAEGYSPDFAVWQVSSRDADLSANEDPYYAAIAEAQNAVCDLHSDTLMIGPTYPGALGDNVHRGSQARLMQGDVAGYARFCVQRGFDWQCADHEPPELDSGDGTILWVKAIIPTNLPGARLEIADDADDWTPATGGKGWVYRSDQGANVLSVEASERDGVPAWKITLDADVSAHTGRTLDHAFEPEGAAVDDDYPEARSQCFIASSLRSPAAQAGADVPLFIRFYPIRKRWSF